MPIPAFSLFVAVGELFVTAAIVTVVWRNLRRRSFPLPLFVAVSVFEGVVNMAYMILKTRAAEAATAVPVAVATVSPTMRVGFAAHGALSVLAYVAFVILGVVAYRQQKSGRFFFAEHPRMTAAFLTAWAISIVSGEAIFAARYLF